MKKPQTIKSNLWLPSMYRLKLYFQYSFTLRNEIHYQNTHKHAHARARTHACKHTTSTLQIFKFECQEYLIRKFRQLVTRVFSEVIRQKLHIKLQSSNGDKRFSIVFNLERCEISNMNVKYIE